MAVIAMTLLLLMNGAVLFMLMMNGASSERTLTRVHHHDENSKQLPPTMATTNTHSLSAEEKVFSSSSTSSKKTDTKDSNTKHTSPPLTSTDEFQLTPITVLNEEFYPITVATSMKEGSCKLLHSAMRQGIQMNVIGYGFKDFKLQHKVGIIMEQISKIKNPNALLLFVDAYDVLFFQNAETIVGKYLKLFEKKKPVLSKEHASESKRQDMHGPPDSTKSKEASPSDEMMIPSSSNTSPNDSSSFIAYCAERNCHPYGLINSAKERWGDAFCNKFPSAPNGYRFLNSGAFMGRKKDIIALYNHIISLPEDVKHDLYGDQGMTSYVWLTTEELKDTIKLDYWGELFFSLLDARMSNLALERQAPKDESIAKSSNSGIWFRNGVHKNYPSIVHGNGWGKHILKNLNSRLTWKLSDLDKEKAVNYCYVNGEKKHISELCSFPK